MDYRDLIRQFEYRIDEDKDNEEDNTSVSIDINNTNVVSGDKLRQIQSSTLKEVAEYLSMTFGPMGSNTKIITGANMGDINTAYSKDGLNVLKHIMNSKPIEMSIIEELVEVTRQVEKEVGDGTTSTVILSSLIFDNLLKIKDAYNITPYQLIREFKTVAKEIQDKIKSNSRECTFDDIYDIAMISTNGDEEVAQNIQDIYKKYGKDVDISLGISNTKDNQLKEYDGMTITEGFSDPAFINNAQDNTCEIRNAHIYYFGDPINTMDMIGYFETILQHNIYDPMMANTDMIPTVICCPQLSRDLSASLKRLVMTLYQYDNRGSQSAKPPILIVSDIVASDEAIMNDIANLCGCKTISKYIDPEQHKRDVEAGLAPTMENIHEWYGEADLVVADSKKTKFINPAHMMINDNGEVKEDPVYTSMINFLTTEIENTKASDDAHSIGLLKKRLSALKSNMVDYLVGGVTISERDAIKDLVEDAIKNCKSASMYNVGYAANFEGLRASYKVLNDYYDKVYPADESEVKIAAIQDIALCIFKSYFDIAAILYGTVEFDKDKVKEYIIKSLDNNMPYDISDAVLSDDNKGDNVLCSIMLDINILDTLSKIITMMCTSNQCLLQASHLNVY